MISQYIHSEYIIDKSPLLLHSSPHYTSTRFYSLKEQSFHSHQLDFLRFVGWWSFVQTVFSEHVEKLGNKIKTPSDQCELCLWFFFKLISRYHRHKHPLRSANGARWLLIFFPEMQLPWKKAPKSEWMSLMRAKQTRQFDGETHLNAEKNRSQV